MTDKNKMQNVSFRSVEELLDFIPEDELKLVLVLRNLILDSVPGLSEKLSFNVPYYFKNRGLFFIWPASVLWGKQPTYKGVRFGFQQGYLMSDDSNYLDKGDRKQVFWKEFQDLKDIDLQLLKAYIFEAVLIDEQFKKKK